MLLGCAGIWVKRVHPLPSPPWALGGFHCWLYQRQGGRGLSALAGLICDPWDLSSQHIPAIINNSSAWLLHNAASLLGNLHPFLAGCQGSDEAWQRIDMGW